MSTLLLTCGALAREVLALRDQHSWMVDVVALPALLHNTPGAIPGAVVQRIHKLRETYERIIVIYGDCGTSGALDTALDEIGVERVAGPHCYEMYGSDAFNTIMAEQPGTYFLTDYLVQSFDHLVIEGMGLDRHPELREVYFANYTQVVYLQQRNDPALVEKAREAADYLGLPLTHLQTGYGALEARLVDLLTTELDG